MLCQMLGAVHAAMLASGAAETEHKVGKAALQIALYMGIGKPIHAVEEGKYLAVVLEKTDDGLVEACKFLVRLITPGIVGAATVEDISSAIAAIVDGYALAIGEAEDTHHERALAVVLGKGGGAVLRVGCVDIGVGGAEAVGTVGCRLLYPREGRKEGEPLEHIHHVGIGEEVAHTQQLAQIVDGWGDAIDKVALALKIAAEAIGSQHLEGAEEHEEGEPLGKVAHRRHLGILAQRLVILIDQLAPELGGIACRRLPEEGGEVIIVGTTSATLVVDEMGIAIVIEHHVACLKVAVEETLGRLGGQVAGEHTKAGFEFELMKVEFGGFEEAVLEVIEVEEHTLFIELGLRIAHRPIEAARTAQLDVGELADGAHKELALGLGVASASLASAPKGVKEGGGAQVGLQIAQLVVGHSQDGRHGQLAVAEMAGKADEGMVLVAAGAHNAYHREPVGIGKTIVDTVAAGASQLLYMGGLGSAPLAV